MNSELDRSFRIPPLALCAIGVLAVVFVFRTLAADLEAKGFATISTLSSRVLPMEEGLSIPEWVDPRWERELSRFVAEFEDLSASDQQSIEGLVREIESRSYVAEVGTASVLWPDGLAVEIRFEKPTACLGVEGEFLTTSATGTVLPGAWASPPEVRGAPLPVLSAESYSRAEVRPGLDLVDPALFAALRVANSMQAHLSSEERRELGPVVIDASGEGEISLQLPGIVLDLEFGRRIFFGRAPGGDAPGELPAGLKWPSVARGVEALQSGMDWILLDVRWDEPMYVTREGEEGSL